MFLLLLLGLDSGCHNCVNEVCQSQSSKLAVSFYSPVFCVGPDFRIWVLLLFGFTHTSHTPSPLQNIVFRDLKPDNVGFDVDNMIKIFDFGLARDLGCVARSGEILGFTGTPRYMANEIGEGRRYGLEVDIYS